MKKYQELKDIQVKDINAGGVGQCIAGVAGGLTGAALSC